MLDILFTLNGKKYHTHIIPSGVFYGIKSVIGPDCYINMNDFHQEMEYLRENGFDTSLVKISPRAHIITSTHKDIDLKKYKKKNKEVQVKESHLVPQISLAE